MIELRNYQKDMIARIRGEMAYNHHKRVCGVLGCGGGKSVIIAEIVKSATERKNQVLFLVHRKELVNQIKATLQQAGVDMDYCQCEMVQTATRHINRIKPPVLIITDETHHILSTSYQRILTTFPNALSVGFTATPIRMNEGGLGKAFDCLVEGVSTQWLIDNHFLAPFKAYSVPLADTTKLHTKQGDFDKAEIAELMEKGAIFGDTVKHWQRLANGKKTIVYCASIKASNETTQAFRNAGVVAEHLDGTTPDKERDAKVQAFRDGKITVLCNVDLFGEGFDVPDCECVVMLRPTASLTLHIQQSMRSMRYKPGKLALILDHVGNLYRHGLPTDKREWTLATKKHKKKNEVHAKECPACLAIVSTTATECPYCHYDFPLSIADRAKVQIEAELVEFKGRAGYDYKDIKTFEALDLFRKAHGYKWLWVIHKALELSIPIPPKYSMIAWRIRHK